MYKFAILFTWLVLVYLVASFNQKGGEHVDGHTQEKTAKRTKASRLEKPCTIDFSNHFADYRNSEKALTKRKPEGAHPFGFLSY